MTYNWSVATAHYQGDSVSFNWENVIWQSKDGSWNRAYFQNALAIGSDESYDEAKWNSNFSFDEFAVVRTGFRTREQAYQWEPYGDPGTTQVFWYHGNRFICEVFDSMGYHFRDAGHKTIHYKVGHPHY